MSPCVGQLDLFPITRRMILECSEGVNCCQRTRDKKHFYLEDAGDATDSLSSTSEAEMRTSWPSR